MSTLTSTAPVTGLGAADHTPDPPGYAVQTFALTKRFGAQTVVDGLDLQVPTGSVFGFLGPNGSGKTTTIRMLLGLVTPTSGRWSLFGLPQPHQAASALHRVGALVEGPAFHPYLTGRANLARLDAADAYADPRTATRRIDTALDRVGLTAAAGKKYRAYSLGMRQRLAIAGALLVPRDLLVLDEPTNGLDPQGTREVRSLIGALAGDGTTVLVSSHLLSEVEQVCTDVAMMRTGRLVAQGPIASIRAAAVTQCHLVTDRPDAAATTMRGLGVGDVVVGADRVTGVLGDLPGERVVAALVHAGLAVREFRLITPSLEDTFVSLTGEGFDVSG